MAAYRSFEFPLRGGGRKFGCGFARVGFDGIDRVLAVPGRPWREYGSGFVEAGARIVSKTR
jgi:hypothetical protein